MEYQFEKMKDFMSTVGSNQFIHTGSLSMDEFISKFHTANKEADDIQKRIPSLRNLIWVTAQKIIGLMK